MLIRLFFLNIFVMLCLCMRNHFVCSDWEQQLWGGSQVLLDPGRVGQALPQHDAGWLQGRLGEQLAGGRAVLRCPSRSIWSQSCCGDSKVTSSLNDDSFPFLQHIRSVCYTPMLIQSEEWSRLLRALQSWGDSTGRCWRCCLMFPSLKGANKIPPLLGDAEGAVSCFPPLKGQIYFLLDWGKYIISTYHDRGKYISSTAPLM